MNNERIIKLLELQLKSFANREKEHLDLIKKQSGQIDRLSEEVTALTQSIRSLEESLLEKDKSLIKLSGKNRSLSKLVSSKSEKRTPSRESTPDLAATKPRAVEVPTAKERGNNGARRKEYFDLETKEHDIWPEADGFDTSKAKVLHTVDAIRYEYIPPRFIKHIYHQHHCVWSGSIHAGKLPGTPLLNSNFDASVIAGILQLRYIYSLPVERIVKLFSENGFAINKATAHGLIKKAAILFDSFEEALKSAVLEDDYINMDESYHLVLAEGERSTTGKKSCKAYFWAALARHSSLVHFFYDKGSRGRKVFTDYLNTDYRGAIQSDGLENYKILETTAYPHAIRLSCFQHCKRKFLDIEGNKDAEHIVDIINMLYQKEHKADPGWSPQQKLEYRQRYAPPIFQQLKEALIKIKKRKSTLPKSALGKAVNYALREFDALCNYIKDPEYEPDNNAIERIMRYISLSRRNSLFCGSHAAAKRTALIYSLACSCRLNNINTFEYFRDILQKLIYINPMTAKKDIIRNMLPDKWGKDLRLNR